MLSIVQEVATSVAPSREVPVAHSNSFSAQTSGQAASFLGASESSFFQVVSDSESSQFVEKGFLPSSSPGVRPTLIPGVSIESDSIESNGVMDTEQQRENSPIVISDQESSSESSSSSTTSGVSSSANVARNSEEKSAEKERAERLRQSKMNEKICILDFKVPGKDRLMDIQKIMNQHTNIRDFSMKTLENGGIAIFFRSNQARHFAQKTLNKHLKDKLQDKRKKFGDNKKYFEISSRVPDGMDPELIKSAIDAAYFKTRSNGIFIFFMKSAASAQLLIENGLLMEDTYLNFKPFVFAPFIACNSCGSKEHRSCTRRLCDYCAGDHDALQCRAAEDKCFYCGGSHQASHCDVRSQQRQALQRKKESYAEILKKNSPASIPNPTTSARSHYAFINEPRVHSSQQQTVALPVHPSPAPASNFILIAGHTVEKTAVKAIIEIVCSIFQLDVTKVTNVLKALESLSQLPNSVLTVNDSSSSSPENEMDIVAATNHLSSDQSAIIVDNSSSSSQNEMDVVAATNHDSSDQSAIIVDNSSSSSPQNDVEVCEDSLDAGSDPFMDICPSVDLTKRKNRDASHSPVSKAKSRRPSRSRSPPQNFDDPSSEPVSCNCGQVFTHIRQIRSHFKAKTLCGKDAFINCRCGKLTLQPSSHESIRDLFYEHIESQCPL
jgi:hypothetical protein